VKKYANSPIVEAVCEFRFTKDTKWDQTIPGLFYEKVKSEFPNKKENVVRNIEIMSGPEDKVEHKINSITQIQFLREDGKEFFQLGQNSLSVHKLKPYVSWEDFKPAIEKGCNALVETIETVGIERIGLRYINQIDIPSNTPVKLEDFFEYRPFFGENLPKEMKSFLVGCMLPFNGERDLCNLKFSSGGSPQGDSRFMLDFDYSLAKPNSVRFEDGMDWIEQAHANLDVLFEGCITDKLRELFGEINQARVH
jgi:uncharacterized protein (TIGR04255 family)